MRPGYFHGGDGDDDRSPADRKKIDRGRDILGLARHVDIEQRERAIIEGTQQLKQPGAPAPLDVGRNPIQVFATPDGRFVYVANQGTEDSPDNTVSVIEVATNTVVATIVTGRGAHGVVVSSDGATVFVTNILDATVSAIDVATQTVIATISVGKGPNGITYLP